MSKPFKKIITLGDIYGYNLRLADAGSAYIPLLISADDIASFPFLSSFYTAETAQSTYDMDIFTKYRSFAPAFNSFSVAELKDQIADDDTYTKRFFTYNSDDNSFWTDLVASYMRQSVKGFLSSHADAYQHIYDALGVEYKPLENYSMTENGTDTYGEDSTTRAFGEDSTSNAYGEQSSTLTTGAQDTTNTAGIYGYNSSSASSADTSTTSAGARTDTSTEAARTDTTTRAEHTDTDTRAEHSDSHSLTRSGNIGVTTSQQMLQSEIDLRKASIFWDLVTGDIIKSLFYLPDEGVTVL